ncbi:MAG: site-specific integrase [Clostridia bacterium]|nr:site-specific integrase [Clostridia bacterium]
MAKNGYTVRADGRLQTSLIDQKTGKRIYFYGKSPKEIKQKIFEYSQKIETGALFAEVSSAWWEEAEPQLAMQSRRGYLQAKKRADSEFENIHIKDIQPKDITAYLKRLSQLYSSQKTIEKYKLVLNLIFKYAAETGEIQYNPCSVAKMPKGLNKAKRVSASEQDEKIIKSCSEQWLFPFFALYTGMRKGEILALQWKDIDFENNVVEVYKSVYHEGDKPNIKGTKTEAGTRFVPLLAPLKERLLQIEPRKAENFIFSDNGKTPLTNRRYITLFNKYKEATGISCTAHQLRHSFATIAFENDISPKVVQEILGHKQLSTTMDIYTDFRKSHIKEITNILNDKIK